MQCHRLGHHTHVVFETVEPGVHLVETPLHRVFNRRRWVQKMLESRFHEHALAGARSVCCDVKPPANPFAEPNRDFATRRGRALAWSNADLRDMHILIRQFLHFLTFPQDPTIDTAASQYDW
jgi:hypothetical protein